MINDRTRTVLVIEDNWLNRELLCTILEPYYTVLQAENGREGLDLLLANKQKISLILLDIEMPVMNGYEFLEEIGRMEEFATMPIIVTTSNTTAADELKCLENGASDFVTKPYNHDIVLRRVESFIRLKEASAMINQAEHDSLTKYFSQEFFFINSDRLLQQNPETKYDMLVTDVRAFRMLVDRYGQVGGNELISCIVEVLSKELGYVDKGTTSITTTFGRISEDVLAVMCPANEEEGYYEGLSKKIASAIAMSKAPETVVMMGYCKNISHDVPARESYDNAEMAINSIRRQYSTQVAEYDEEMRQKAIRQQQILDRTEEALKECQFEMYYQMKYSFENAKIGGAEALVRWNDAKLGFMSPGEFIPLFERSGLITKLDYYTLMRVCEDVKKWLAEGKAVVPVSVNLSRVDFLDRDLVQNIISIVESYGVPKEYIHLEATESAFIENEGHFLETLGQLREAGFSIELDDFGSGYSSLSILNDLQADVLKLDMGLIRSMNSPRQKVILEHIFSIAEKLNMDVVAEGVETLEQAEELRDMGCTYAQGYYYSKPVPKAEFEEFIK